MNRPSPLGLLVLMSFAGAFGCGSPGDEAEPAATETTESSGADLEYLFGFRAVELTVKPTKTKAQGGLDDGIYRLKGKLEAKHTGQWAWVGEGEVKNDGDKKMWVIVQWETDCGGYETGPGSGFWMEPHTSKPISKVCGAAFKYMRVYLTAQR